MIIKQIMLKNFANVNQIEINLSDSVTYLIGGNGAGKTTIGLNAIWFILAGLAQKGKKVLHGERFRFIGEHGKSAVGKLVLHDEVENIDITITRKLLKNKTELKVTASDRRQLPDDFIDSIFNIFSINPEGFAKLSAQEQAMSLGIDTAKFDSMKKIAYDERTELGRNVKRLQGVVDEIGVVNEVEPVDLQQLLADKDKIEKENAKLLERAQREKDEKVQEAIRYNNEQDLAETNLKNAIHEINSVESQIKDLREKVVQLEADIKEKLITHKDLNEKYDQLPIPGDKKLTNIPIVPPEVESTADLMAKIESAESTNQQAALYQQGVTAQGNLDDAETLHTEKQKEMNSIEADRIAYIKSCNLPHPAITIDDTGGLLIEGRPFSETYFSKGQILRIGIKIAASAKPKLKYVFIPDSQSIDKENREKLFTELVDAGFQVVAEYVDTEKQKDHGSILLKESKVVESYDDDDDALNDL